MRASKLPEFSMKTFFWKLLLFRRAKIAYRTCQMGVAVGSCLTYLTVNPPLQVGENRT